MLSIRIARNLLRISSGGAPNGVYNVYVQYYKRHISSNDTPFTVMVKHEGQTDTYDGVMREVGQAVHVCSFTVVNGVPSIPGASTQPPSSGASRPGSSPNDDRKVQLERERDRLQRELDRVNSELNRINNRR